MRVILYTTDFNNNIILTRDDFTYLLECKKLRDEEEFNNIHFIISNKGYGKTYHEIIKTIKKLESNLKYASKINRICINRKNDYKQRINEAIEYIKGFTSYIPEDSKEDIIDILKSNKND